MSNPCEGWWCQAEIWVLRMVLLEEGATESAFWFGKDVNCPDGRSVNVFVDVDVVKGRGDQRVCSDYCL